MLSPDQMVYNVRSGGVPSRVAKPLLADIASYNAGLKLTNTINIEKHFNIIPFLRNLTVYGARSKYGKSLENTFNFKAIMLFLPDHEVHSTCRHILAIRATVSAPPRRLQTGARGSRRQSSGSQPGNVNATTVSFRRLYQIHLFLLC
jgi:hypothetical protein